MKILLIEDNKEISKNIKEYLELDGAIVDCFFDGVSGLDNAMQKKYDIILLDLMLPGIDGLTISRKLNGRIETPIIIITAKEDIETKLKGFDYGAVDYIVKPFDLRELDARIKVFLYKNHSILYFGEYTLDFNNRVFKKGENDILVGKTEFQILNYIFQNRSRVVSRGEIIEDVWGEDALFDSDSKLDVYISNIRSKFGKDILKTSKGYGYKFNF
ncbi:MAG: response regulator transcription factor [Candidatus Gracilibacteria bacterium]|nr:response regulator transcription factor [Candidatus Gracilibacteria bacterium]